MAVAQWEISSHLRSLTFLFRSADLAIELPTHGWGAFLIRMGTKVCSVFVSGSLSERNTNVWTSQHESTRSIAEAHHQGNFHISRTEDGWKCRNALSGAELLLENRLGNFRLLDASGQLKTQLSEVCSLFGVPAPSAPTAPDLILVTTPANTHLGPDFSTGPEVTEASARGPDPTTRVPASALRAATSSHTPFEVHSKVYGHLLFTVPLSLKEREIKLIDRLAKYGFVTREDLKRLLGRRAETITSELAHRLHEADYPVIRITENQSYEFVAPE